MTHDKPHGFQMLSLEILYWAGGIFAELAWSVSVSKGQSQGRRLLRKCLQ